MKTNLKIIAVALRTGATVGPLAGFFVLKKTQVGTQANRQALLQTFAATAVQAIYRYNHFRSLEDNVPSKNSAVAL